MGKFYLEEQYPNITEISSKVNPSLSYKLTELLLEVDAVDIAVED